ncbi:mitochondrial outer membrane translocase complex, subunit Tom22 [Amylocarpus encephaloides]|uniref:Mitochondrial outer membrane translocase complex, subunit Tom22 n=1 Tax=Amylocarpus encephaloides TaxID=45428 RepID=A0A9P7YF43_9HELO|nr:mitochondrial outer membrane translocase complex, subunit Tom22 [Amylocarpus encephaloides]
MVELIEVEDESFDTKQAGPEENDDDYYTDTDSEISAEDDDEPEEETFADRLLALRDIIPPTTRSYISGKADMTAGWIKAGLFFSGKSLWVLSTSALLLGVPWALASAEEQQVIEMENEMKMREQGQKDIFTEGSTAAQVNAQLNPGAKPAL